MGSEMCIRDSHEISTFSVCNNEEKRSMNLFTCLCHTSKCYIRVVEIIVLPMLILDESFEDSA